MARPDTIVFLGPSLPVEEARALLDADYRPPAAMGDVYRASRQRGLRRIAIIDGYFERMAAPWHKEILWALERGVAVYGAASMGALRAAELEAFGMVGVGTIFAGYKAGRLTDDDEVAVLHGPPERGYAAMSEAMVNVRAGVAAAATSATVTPRTAAALLRIAKAQFYRERSWDSILAAARTAGLPRAQLAAFAAGLVAKPPDAKAADARRLLRLLARRRSPVQRAPVKMARTWFWWRFVDVVGDEPDRDA
jgi:hypothetical protein